MTVSPDRSTPAALRAAWLATVAAGDPEGVRALVTDDYEVWTHGAAPLRGPDAAVAALRGALARFAIRQEFEPLETIVSDDWAFERGTERMALTPRSGGETQQVAQRVFLLLRRGADGQWRFARGMTNGLPPAGGA